MAYQTRQRDPLLDDRTHAALMRLGQQGVGFALLGAAAALVALLVSYAPEDPNFMAATDAMPQNWLGHFGASVAAILMMIVGYGALLLPLVAAVWGVRFLSQAGQDRVIGRAVFVPIAVALASIHAASFSPGEGWTHSFGLGGLFGDTILGAVLNALPVSAEAGLRILSALAFLGGVALTLYVLAVSRAEFRTGLRFLVLGTLSLIGMVSGGLRSAGQGAGIAAQHLAARRATLRETTAHGHAPATRIGADPAMRRVPIVHDDDDDYGDGDEGHLATARSAVPRQMPGILGRVPLLRPRQPESAAEPAAPLARGSGAKAAMLDPTAGIAPPNEDQIRARITDVIKSRVRRPDAVAEAAARRRGILPGSASLRPAAAPAMVAANPAQRVEPPLTAAHRPAPATATAPPAFVEAVDEEPDNMFLEDAIPEPVAPAPRGFSHALPQTELQRRVMTRAATRHSAQSKQAQAEAQPSLPLQSKPAEPSYEPPSLSFLAPADLIERHHLSDEALEENARMLESVLDDYGVKGEIVSVRPGPVVTMYELEPAPGLKASAASSVWPMISRGRCRRLSARVSTVPGRSVIGIELPNEHREKVLLRELLSHRSFGDGNHRLPLALGKDIGGDPIIANLAKMPHLLIAGTTGSGKSVAINTMILSLLYKLSPEECRMIMIDPKMLELSVYDGIPHLLSPVVTDPKKAVVALKWVVGEMEERYRKMSKMGVRNIEGYNGRVREALAKGEMFKRTYQTGFRRRNRRSGLRDRGIQARSHALHRRDRRRDGRPDDGRGQGDRGLHPASGADGARERHPPDHGDAAPVGRCHHRHDQGEFPDADFLPRHVQDRQPHDPGRTGGRAASGHGRHALHGGRRQDHPRPRPLRLRRRGRGDCAPPEILRPAVLCLERARRPGRGPRKRYRRGAGPEHGRQHGWRRCALRSGGGHRDQGPQVFHLLHPAQARHRLQQGRAARRTDGRGGAGQRRQPCRQARDPCAGTGLTGSAGGRRFR
jgi:DNA segregation ATPase FtsK/SpoIIIE, S-DNA-T family